MRVLVRETDDIGSAVTHRLFLAGHVVRDAPTYHLTDATFDGFTMLHGVRAFRVDELQEPPR